MAAKKRYLFLVSWLEGSESACGITGVNSQKDLLPQFLKYDGSNDNLLYKVIETDRGEQAALDSGYSAAFFENYTANDTVSDMVKITRQIEDKLAEIAKTA